MAGERPIPVPTNRRKAARGALLLAVSLLQDERVREQLGKAPTAARDWAAARRRAERADARDADAALGGAGRRGLGSRFDPTRRFGHKGVERRLTALERNAELVVPDLTEPDGATIVQAIDELRRATAISVTMPLNERRKARRRISAELTRLERALVDALLPPSA